MKGKLIVIEGLDGSGKATQAKHLAAALQQQGKQIREISFPNYDSDSSAPVRMYLSGAFGTEPGDVNPYAASSFYAIDRYAGMKQDWGCFYDDGGILIADRYTTSNAIHQCCKLPKEQWDSYLHWLFHDLSPPWHRNQPAADERTLSRRREEKGHPREQYVIS